MMTKLLTIIFLLIEFTAFAQNGDYLTDKLNPGEGALSFLERHGLERSKQNIDRFREINKIDDLDLYADHDYKLPIRVYTYNAVSIRSTLGNNDWDYAKAIQKFNEQVHQAGIKSGDYRKDNVLWVPDYLPATDIKNAPETEASKYVLFPLFGKEFEKVDVISHELSNEVYYVVSGHGGPDPGAMVNNNGHVLCEDEYAYDIALRLARDLLQHDATVYMINQDPNDGIRETPYLKPDKDEVCYPDLPIPLNQVKRLNQRVDAINSLYYEHKKLGAKKQRVIIIHVDSRSSSQRIDMFFYHNPKSETGKELAETLQSTIEMKYAQHQKGRGYSGRVKARNLHMLRETYPVAVYCELGNIRNLKDQNRFLVVDNRQAVANWLCEGLMKEN